jgi:maltose/moltooligosaccharide transporter
VSRILKILPNDIQSQPVSEDAPAQKLYTVGTLVYTPGQLRRVFFWLLFGAFWLSIFQCIGPAIITLKLKALGASNTLASFILVAIPAIANLSVHPAVAYRSDRLRSRWGRRTPFLFISAPILAALTILLAFCDPLGSAAHSCLHLPGGVSVAVVTLAIIAAIELLRQMVNMVPMSIYFYFIADTIPLKYQSRFTSFYMITNTLVILLFNLLIYKHCLDWMRPLFIAAALLYTAGCWLMCTRTREGAYPPPADKIQHGGIAGHVRNYLRQCFSHRLYVFYFLGSMFWGIGITMTAFYVYFWQSMGLDLQKIGILTATVTAAQMLVVIPAGFLSDRFRPLRVMVVCMCIYACLLAVRAVYFAWTPTAGEFFNVEVVLFALISVVGACNSVSAGPAGIELLPRDQYGQFCSARAAVISAGQIAGSIAAGLYIDVLKRLFPQHDYYYRFMCLWQVIFYGLGFLFMYRVYRGKKLETAATTDLDSKL